MIKGNNFKFQGITDCGGVALNQKFAGSAGRSHGTKNS
jgi:hypothetical protein